MTARPVDDYEKAVAREPDNLLYAESSSPRIPASWPDQTGRRTASTRIVARILIGSRRTASLLHAARLGVRTTRRARCAMRSTCSWRRRHRQRVRALPRRSLRCAQSTRRSPVRFATIVYESIDRTAPACRRHPQWWCSFRLRACRVVVLSCGRAPPKRRRIAVRRAATVDKWASGLAIDHRSLQAGLSVRYKP